MDSIRIDTGTKRIQINDGPDFLEFNPSDVSFAERFYSLMGEFQTKIKEYTDRAETLEAEKEEDANGIPLNTNKRLGFLRESCEYIREKIDSLFGAGTSQKAFGDTLSLEVFTQFFTQITPYIQTARAAKVEQYTSPASAKRSKHSKKVMK